MSIESEIRDIKKGIIEISKKLDEIMRERENISLMKLSQESKFSGRGTRSI